MIRQRPKDKPIKLLMTPPAEAHTKKPSKTTRKAKTKPTEWPAQQATRIALELEEEVAKLEKEIEELKTRNALLEKHASAPRWSETDTKSCWYALTSAAINKPVWAIDADNGERTRALLLYYCENTNNTKDALLLICSPDTDGEFWLTPGVEVEDSIFEYTDIDCFASCYDGRQDSTYI